MDYNIDRLWSYCSNEKCNYNDSEELNLGEIWTCPVCKTTYECFKDGVNLNLKVLKKKKQTRYDVISGG